jgi:hypothetical protein
MNAPWFTLPFAPIPGIFIGIGGGMFGLLAGFVFSSPSSNAKWLALFRTFYWVLASCSAAILLSALAALTLGQPRSVWYALLIPGIAGTAVFAASFRLFVASAKFGGPDQSADPILVSGTSRSGHEPRDR